MVYVVNVLGELKSLDLGLEMVAGDCYPSWFCATVVLGKSVDVYETKHWAIVDMEATIKQFWAILEAVLLVSKLKAEITFYAVFVGGGWSQWRLFFLQDGSYRCRWLIVWLVGRICITSPWRIATSSVQQISFDFSGIVHTWSVVTRERLSSLACHRMEDIMHKCNGTFWTFTLWIFILQTVYTGIG